MSSRKLEGNLILPPMKSGPSTIWVAFPALDRSSKERSPALTVKVALSVVEPMWNVTFARASIDSCLVVVSKLVQSRWCGEKEISEHRKIEGRDIARAVRGTVAQPVHRIIPITIQRGTLPIRIPGETEGRSQNEENRKEAKRFHADVCTGGEPDK